MAKAKKQRTKQKSAVKRPLGVTIICILGWLGAALYILAGLVVLLADVIPASLFLVIGIVIAVALFWLWQMKKTGWTIVIVLEAMSFLLAIASFSIVGIVISGIIVAYLWTKKDFFK